MKIGRSVFATFDGVTYTGKVTAYDQDGLTFVTADGTSFSAPLGVAHKTHNVIHLFGEGSAFVTPVRGAFKAGDVIASKETGVVTQAVTVNVDGSAITVTSGDVINPEDFYKLGDEPYVYSESSDEVDDSDDDESEDDDEDEDDGE